LTSKNKEEFEGDLTILFDGLTIEHGVFKEIIQYDGYYLAINANSEIEQKFNSFEDYLQSDFTIDDNS
jgi:hypothetical protein